MLRHNLVQVFENSLKRNWDLPSMSNYKAETYTYGQVAEEIIKMHILFDKCISKGDKIALVGKNSVNWAIVYLATVTYGATVVPILTDFHPENITNIINHSDSVILFVGQQVLEKINIDELSALKGVVKLDDFTVIKSDKSSEIKHSCDDLNKAFNEHYQNGLNKEQFELPEVESDNIAVISYTSGTTGFSKGVMLPLESLMANVKYAWDNMPLETNDPLLSILPLAHSYGCAFEFLWPFSIGVHITFLGKIVSPQAMIKAFDEIKPRLLLMVPLIMEKIYKKQIQPTLQKPLIKFLLTIPGINQLIYKKIKTKLMQVFGGQFREVVIGGAALNKDVEQFLRKIKFNFSVGYGMTECGPLISYANWDRAKLGSCGSLVDSLELTIDSPDPQNIAGEILVRGTNVMKGYYKNSEATNKAIDEQGWLHTGDLGVVDKNNFVFIRGRSKSMILGASGENIYPEEIEAKLSNMPFVQEQIVISDENKLVALVFPDFEKLGKEGVGELELIEIMDKNKMVLNETLPKYSQISQIRIQNKEFEKTPKQNIKRFLYEKKA